MKAAGLNVEKDGKKWEIVEIHPFILGKPRDGRI
jgi:hypothetical protein